jgi:hypothetical protein
MRGALHQDVARRIDLELMCREGDQERNTLDLHVNFTEYYQAVVSMRRR